MGDEIESAKWSVTCKSVRGASHTRTGLPNQDAHSDLPQTGECVMLAISDGHGSPTYFRSDKGARFAVSVARTVMQPFLGQTSRTKSKHSAEEQLPQKLVRAWRKAVEKDVEANPFTPEEEKQLIQQVGQGAWEMVKKEHFRAYGATLLAVLITQLFIIYVQLGDGDILTVSKEAEVSRPPLYRDERQVANETSSLCSPQAWNDIQVYFQPLSDANKAPALIILSTDGYINSFRNQDDFLKAGSDYLEIMCVESAEYVNANLDQWLNEATELGSGDDITVGLLYRPKTIEDIRARPVFQAKEVSCSYMKGGLFSG